MGAFQLHINTVVPTPPTTLATGRTTMSKPALMLSGLCFALLSASAVARDLRARGDYADPHARAVECSPLSMSWVQAKSTAQERTRALAEAEDVLQKQPTASHRERLARALIRNHEYDLALSILTELELEEPGDYRVAYSMADALESLDQDDSSREWLRAALRLRYQYGNDPRVWLRTLILDAKRAAQADDHWLAKNGVLDIDFGPEAAPAKDYFLPMDDQGRPLNDPRAALQAICLELQQRLPRTSRPDPVIGSLLFDAGNIAFHHGGLQNALNLFELADAYSGPDQALLRRRIALTRDMLAQRPRESAYSHED